MARITKKPPQQKPKGQRGPPAERLVLDGYWKDAVGAALKRGKPLTGKTAKKKRPSK
jgi:hypothetical protein